MQKITCKELKPELWDDLEELFGSKGACGGCWCMYWRVKKGEKWDELKGDVNKQRLKKLVKEETVHGVIAYSGKDPVGWCSFDKRPDYFKLDRAPSFACDDADKVWSIPCFYIKSGFRGVGVGTALLSFAVKTLKGKYKAKIIEGYPVKIKSNTKMPAAFAWTGTYSLFLKADFKPVGKLDGAKQRMRFQK